MGLWTAYPNPSDGAVMRDWFKQVDTLCETWRIGEIEKAEANGTTAPPLLRVNFTSAKEWANDMKAKLNGPLLTGAVNESSQTMSNQLDNYMNSTDRAENRMRFQDGALGSAVDRASLALTVPHNAEVSQAIPLTTSAITEKMPTRPSKRRKIETPIDHELLRRREVEAAKMKELRIEQDSGTKRRLNCRHNNIPHTQLEKSTKSSKPQTFCPLADDAAIYQQICIARNEKRRQYDTERYQKKN
jgi:hypothetical protein